MNLVQKTSHLLTFGLSGGCMLLAMAANAEPLVIPFETHAAFFSAEMHIKDAIDPQVFVKDAAGFCCNKKNQQTLTTTGSVAPLQVRYQ